MIDWNLPIETDENPPRLAELISMRHPSSGRGSLYPRVKITPDSNGWHAYSFGGNPLGASSPLIRNKSNL